MARIRTIKPDFFTSEQISECSRDARLLFIGIWNFCDDAGIHPVSYKQLKMQIFPGDDCLIDEIKGWVDELLREKLLIEYEVSSKRYWQVTGWHHQRIEKPSFKYPNPSVINSTTNDGKSTTNDGSSMRIDPRKGMERKVNKEKEKKINKRKEKEKDPCFDEFWKSYPKREGSNSKHDAHKAWNARLREKYTVDQIMEGLRRYINYCNVKQLINTQFVKQAVTFIGPALHFLESWEVNGNANTNTQSYIHPADIAAQRREAATRRLEKELAEEQLGKNKGIIGKTYDNIP